MLQESEAFARYKPFFLPVGLIVVGIAMLGIAALALQGTFSSDSGVEIIDSAADTGQTALQGGSEIIVEVAGAVAKPGVYHFQSGSRVEDALTASGGVTQKANKNFVEQSINRASKLNDGQKIYIPFEGESEVKGAQSATTKLLNINSASGPELEALSGVGPATATKIIQGRPYSSIEELTTKKIVSSKVFEAIKSEVSVY